MFCIFKILIFALYFHTGEYDVEMGRITYIRTDAHTANLAEMQLLKMESFELIIRELMAKVGTLSNPLDYSQLFTEQETADRLSISLSSLSRLRRLGEIHYHKIGINIRYSLGDIVEYEGRCRR